MSTARSSSRIEEFQPLGVTVLGLTPGVAERIYLDRFDELTDALT